MTTEPVERLREAVALWDAFVAARNAMNAARPQLEATRAERALYDERYDADHEAERAFRGAAHTLFFNGDAQALLAAIESRPQPIVTTDGLVEQLREPGDQRQSRRLGLEWKAADRIASLEMEREIVRAFLRKRSVPTMDPIWSAGWNCALDHLDALLTGRATLIENVDEHIDALSTTNRLDDE